VNNVPEECEHVEDVHDCGTSEDRIKSVRVGVPLASSPHAPRHGGGNIGIENMDKVQVLETRWEMMELTLTVVYKSLYLQRQSELAGLTDSNVCRYCGAAEESYSHVVVECRALSRLRVTDSFKDALVSEKSLTKEEVVARMSFLAAIRETRGVASQIQLTREDVIDRMCWVNTHKAQIWAWKEERETRRVDRRKRKNPGAPPCNEDKPATTTDHRLILTPLPGRGWRPYGNRWEMARKRVLIGQEAYVLGNTRAQGRGGTWRGETLTVRTLDNMWGEGTRRQRHGRQGALPLGDWVLRYPETDWGSSERDFRTDSSEEEARRREKRRRRSTVEDPEAQHGSGAPARVKEGTQAAQRAQRAQEGGRPRLTEQTEKR